MKLETIRRHAALAVQCVEEPNSNDFDYGVSWYRTKRLTSFVINAREACVGSAAGMGNLGNKHCLIDVDITDDDVNIGIVVLGMR